MPRIDQLTVIVPGMLTALRSEFERTGTLPELPGLTTLLRTADLAQLWSPDELRCARLDAWQTALLQALGDDGGESGLASAALHWLGEGQPLRAGTCLHLEPVHLAAGLDRLHLAELDVEAQERAQLADSLRMPLASAGLELHTTASGRWYAWGPSTLEAVTYSPRSPFRDRVYDIMPSGADGARLRRLMTEIQMLWHAHPVNVQRERRGAAAVNGLWFWGAAPLQRRTFATAVVLSTRPYVRGLHAWSGIICASLPATADDLLSQATDKIIAVLEHDTPQVQDARWLAACADALRRGRIQQLDLRLDHWRIVVRGGAWHHMKRTFTKGHTVAELLA